MATVAEKERLDAVARELRLIGANIRKQAQAVQQPFRGRLETCADALGVHAAWLDEIVE